MADWNRRFLDLCDVVAGWSKDPSTKVGAVITDNDNRVISVGYNGFPRKADDKNKERYERPLKYRWTEHAERNAIYNAAKIGVSTDEATMYIRWFPCTDCARGIIQSGIKKLVCSKPDFTDERWGADFKISHEMLEECGITLEFE